MEYEEPFGVSVEQKINTIRRPLSLSTFFDHCILMAPVFSKVPTTAEVREITAEEAVGPLKPEKIVVSMLTSH